MSSFRHLSLYTFCVAALARAQTLPASNRASESIEHLNTLVVSAGPDAKAAFDLAQGTSILTGDELLRRNAATLGETLAATAGVNQTYHGPGASRPIIRGLGGDRIRVLENGIGALDASSISPDHNTAIEPLFASRIEVLRGPATLLYGSSAVGGVVNVIDRRIPDAPGEGQLHGSTEARFGSGSDELTGVVALNLAHRTFALQVDALRQKTGDVDIPDFAITAPGGPAGQPRGTLPNSARDTRSGSLGSTAFWSVGHLGAALSQYETIYGVPTGDVPPVTINLKQTRLDLAGEITQPFGIFRSAKARLGLGRYRHSELSGDDVATTFKNKAWEGRLELPHIQFGDVAGTVGLQGSFSDFSAVGDEVVTPAFKTASGALFALEELKLPGATLQFGGRYERQSIRLGDVDGALPRIPGYTARSGQRRNFNGISGSVGVVVYPAADYSLGFALAYTERLPTAQELFSNGPHGGTGSYEVGTGSLAAERSLGIDVSLRKRAGLLTGTIGVFANRFSGYIFENELTAGAIPFANNPDGLVEYQFVARDALFFGGEAEVILHLIETDRARVHLRLLCDYVHAEQRADRVPLPRIPPLRLGVGLDYEDTLSSLGVEARHANRQNRFAPLETETSDHTLLNAHLSRRFGTKKMSGIQTEIFLRADNLTNTTARVATSFLKDVAPLPGRSMTIGVRVHF